MRVSAPALGVLLFAASVLSYPWLLHSFARPAFVVELQAPDVSESGVLSFHTDATAAVRVDGSPYPAAQAPGPGLHHLRRQRVYAGGHDRSVGHTQLVGPLQDPADPPCSTHLLVDQSFLDDGEAGEGTMAHVASALIGESLLGMNIWPLGRFETISELRLRWARFQDEASSPKLRALARGDGLEAPLSGYLHLALELRFGSGKVPLRVSLVPRIVDARLEFRLIVDARLELENRFYQLVVNLFDGNDRVSRIIERELRKSLLYMLDAPPGIPFGKGAQLELSFCQGRQLIFHPRGFVAVPLAIALQDRAPYPPLQEIDSAPLDEELQAPLAIDIDRNGLNAIAHNLWSSELLDHEVAGALVSGFNEQESVRDYLNLRIESARFHLPPTIELLDGGLRLRAALRAQLIDGEHRSEAQLFTQVAWPLVSYQTGADLALTLDDIQMSCEPAPGRLQACYPEILAQVRANQVELQTRLAQTFAELLRQLLQQREVGDPSVPAVFALERTILLQRGAVLRAELFGQLTDIQ